MSYCERMLELLTDLEAQLPTRKFFSTLLDSAHLIVSCTQNKPRSFVEPSWNTYTPGQVQPLQPGR